MSARIDEIAAGLTWAGLAQWWEDHHGGIDGLTRCAGGMWETEEGELIDAQDAFRLLSDDMPEDVWHTESAMDTQVNLTSDMELGNLEIVGVTVHLPGDATAFFDAHHVTIRHDGDMTIIEDEIGVGTYLIEQARNNGWGG